MLPTPIPPSPSELAIPKVAFKGRMVSGKKPNSPYFVHQRHKQNQSKNQQSHPIQPDPADHQAQNAQPPLLKNSLHLARPFFLACFHYSLLTLLISLLLSRMITENWLWGYDGKYTKWQYYFPPPQTRFTLETLSEYDGVKDPSKPILLAINGIVYNVNSNPNMYGPGGSYHHFVGKDASRAFVTGCFKSGLTYDLRGLDNKQKKSIDYWTNFYENSSKYSRVGTVELPVLGEEYPIPKDCDPKQEGGAM